MNKYKLLKDLLSIPAGTEGIQRQTDGKYVFYGDAVNSMTITEKMIKDNPDWFAPVIDYREKLEEMGWDVYKKEKFFEAVNRNLPSENSYPGVSAETLEIVYEIITGQHGNQEEAKETKAILFAKADDPVTLDEICAYLKKKGDLFIKLSYEGYGSIINMENLERRNFRNLEQLKTILRS